MVLRIVILGNGLPESYFIWSNSCQPTVQYSHIRNLHWTFMFTQLDEASQTRGHVN